MKSRKISIGVSRLSLAVLVLAVTQLALAGEKADKSVAAVSGSAIIDDGAFIDANRVFSFVTNRGVYGRDLLGGYSFNGGGGLVFPYAGLENLQNGLANKTPLFAGGIWLGAVDVLSGDTLIALSEYSSEFVPGPMVGGTFQPDQPEFKVYKIHRDSLANNPNEDYLNWPSDQGAPTLPGGVPLILGDQTLWTVFNDANPATHTNDAGETAPMGIEVQQLMWATDTHEGGDTTFLDTILAVSHNGNTQFPSVSVIVKDYNAVTGDEYSVVFAEDTALGIYWRLINNTADSVVLDSQLNFLGDDTSPIVDGLQIRVVERIIAGRKWEYFSADPLNVSPVAAADNGYAGAVRWFTGGDHGGELFFGGVFLEPKFWGATTLDAESYRVVEIRYRPMQSYTDLNGDGRYSIGEPYVVDDPSQTQKAFMYQTFSGFSYEGVFDVPYTVWDVSDSLNPLQLNVVVRDRDANFQWDLHRDTTDALLPNGGDQRYNYTWILGTDYDPTGTMYGDGTGGTIDFFGGAGGAVEDAMWALWLDERGTTRGMLAEECRFRLTPQLAVTPLDTFTFATPKSGNFVVAGGEANAIYFKYTLINKGTRNLAGFYVGIWSDPDLGQASDDLVGCDTLDDLFSCYNADNDDLIYGANPPAIGWKIVEGPIVPSPGDTAYVDRAPVEDFRNLHISSFHRYLNGLDPDSYQETYRNLTGFRKDGQPYIHPLTQDTTTFEVSGDPVTGSGWLDVNESDRRMVGMVGPFNMVPGDTQSITVKLAVGQGADRLESITKLREILNTPPDFPTGVNDDDTPALPRVYALGQNYPNPFNPVTRIRYSLPRRSIVKLDVFNILGQKITTLVDSDLPAGEHAAIWDASDFASGMYFYRLRAGEKTLARKMVLLK